MVVKTQIPLLKDHHTHPFMYAVLSRCIDLKSVSNKQEALSLIKSGNDEINVILGWNNSLYLFEQRELEQLPAVVICNTSLHRFLINRAAREKLGASHQEILAHLDEMHWVEKNLPKILNLIASIKSYHPEQIERFYHALLQQGVWYAEELLLPNEGVIHLFKEQGYFERTRFWADMETFHSLSREAQRDVYGIKIFTDGALGSETAALDAPYLTTGKKGPLVYSDEELYAIIRQVVEINKAVALHAIGDSATAQIVTVLSLIKDEQGTIPPTRIEHCQFISQREAQNAKSLGITLSMQPNFSWDSVQYRDRLSEKDQTQNNPFRMLIDEIGFVPGQDLVFGSDGMPHGVQNALESALFPPFPRSQALTLDEFVGGYCMPDKTHGYIEVTIDEDKRRVLTTVQGV